LIISRIGEYSGEKPACSAITFYDQAILIGVKKVLIEKNFPLFVE
jgi:hypothetical protein